MRHLVIYLFTIYILAASRIYIRNPCKSEADKLYNITEILKRLRELNVPVSTIKAEGEFSCESF